MHKIVPVRVKKPTEIHGTAYVVGDELLLPTLEALIAARRGLVTILRHLTPQTVTDEFVGYLRPQTVVVTFDEVAPAPPAKTKRTYKRRDLQAEAASE